MEVTLGNLVDQLSICNLRIWILEDVKRKPDATDAELADATRKTNSLNVQRNLLIEAIDKKFGETQFGQGSNKLYGR